MTHHVIPMEVASEDRQYYGIRYTSVYVYQNAKSHSPTRIVWWDNTDRVNKRNGEKPLYGQYGLIDGGNGKYLDPHNKATDSPVSVEISLESSAICADTSMNTGQPGSGQVYDDDEVLRDGDTASLVLRTDSMPVEYKTMEVILHLPKYNNGYGHAEFIKEK